MAERNRYSDWPTEVSCGLGNVCIVLDLTGEGAVKNTVLFLAQFSARLRFCMPSPV